MTWSPPTEFPRLPREGLVGTDTETYDPDLGRRKGSRNLGPGWMRPGFRVAGYSLAVDGGPSLYVPLSHAGGQNVENPEAWIRWLHDWARTFRGLLAMLNAQYDLLAYATLGIEFPLATICDVGVADALIDERHDSYSLRAVAERWKVPAKLDMANVWDIAQRPAGEAAEYAIRDAEIPVEVYKKQRPVLRELELEDVWALEQRVTPALVAMTRRGVRVDLERLEQVERQALADEVRVLGEIKDATGVGIELGGVWKKKPLVAALKAVDVHPSLTKQGLGRQIQGLPIRPCDHEITQFFLEGIEHPVGRMIVRARQFDKISSSFAKSIRSHQVGGRVHCTFNQLRGAREDGSRVGAPARTSAMHPNLQQQPIRTSGTWRSIYVPERGERWVKLDWAAQELRTMVHFGEVLGFPSAFLAGTRYRQNPKLNLFRELADKMERDYKRVKNGAYAVCFGAGLARLASTIDLPDKDAARAFKNDLYQAAPFLKDLFDNAIKEVRDNGYVRTPLGRRIRFKWGVVNEFEGEMGWIMEYKALANVVSPTSADQAKEAMATMHEEGIPLRLFVHDEFDLSSADPTQVEQCREIMERAPWTTIPFVAEATVGNNWGDCK